MPDSKPHLAELRRLHEAATPGVWSTTGEAWQRRGLCDDRGGEIGCFPYERAADLRFIVALRNACPALLSAAEQNEQYCARLAERESERRELRALLSEALLDVKVSEERLRECFPELMKTPPLSERIRSALGKTGGENG